MRSIPSPAFHETSLTSLRDARFWLARRRREACLTVAVLLVTTRAPLLVAHATGPVPEEPSTVRVSTSAAGAEANGESGHPSLSSTGRFVAFTSSAANLVPGDTNELADVFVKDRETGTIARASVASAGGQANGESSCAAISGDGSRAVFTSEASNLVPGDTNGVADVFLRDLAAGTTMRLSESASGAQADQRSLRATISADGRFVAFASDATNLVEGDQNRVSDVFVRDLQTGSIERVSVGPGGSEAAGASDGPALSSDGRFVAFASAAANLLGPQAAPDTNGVWDVFVCDRTSVTLRRASVSSAGAEGDGHSFAPVLDGTGSLVAFTSLAANLAGPDTNLSSDVFLHDLGAGTTVRASVDANPPAVAGASAHAATSGDGRWVAWQRQASASSAAPGGTRRVDVFLLDRASGSVACLTALAGAALPGVGSGAPCLSADGHWIAFASTATDLASGDANGEPDVFLRGPLP